MFKLRICLMSLVATVLATNLDDNFINPEFILGTPLTEITTPPPPKNCTDNITICDKYLSLCTNELYKPVMNIQCPKTCKFCKVCEDKSEKCSSWKSAGFCSNEFYAELVKNLCAYTCNLCE